MLKHTAAPYAQTFASTTTILVLASLCGCAATPGLVGNFGLCLNCLGIRQYSTELLHPEAIGGVNFIWPPWLVVGWPVSGHSRSRALRRRNVRFAFKVELFQSLCGRETRLLYPPLHRPLAPIVHFRFHQRFEVTQMAVLLFHRLVGQTLKMSTDRRQTQLFGVLPDRRLIQYLSARAHCSTSVGRFGSNRS